MLEALHDVFEVDRLVDQVEQGGAFEPEGARERCQTLDQWVKDRSDDSSTPPSWAPEWLGGLRLLQGHFAYVDGEIETAIGWFEQATASSAASGELKFEAYAQRRLALCHEYAGRQAESIDCALRSLGLAEQLGDARVLSRAHTGLLALYESQGAYEQALETGMRLHEIAAELDDPLLLAASSTYAALFSGYLGRAAEGLVWIGRALELAAEGDFPHIALHARFYRFWLYQENGQISEAIAAAEQEMGAIAGLPAQNAAAVYVDIAEIHVAAGNLEHAAEMLRSAEEVVDSERLNGHLIRFYKVSADLHEANGDMEMSLRMLRQYIDLDGQLRGRQARARLIMVERHFAAELAAKTEEIHQLRTVELVEKNDQLAALNRQKDEILNVVAHDLRNPLAAAQMLSESLMIDTERGTGTRADRHEQLSSIRAATSVMGATIDTLLHLQQHATPQVLASVDEVVSQSLAWAERAASKRQINLRADVRAVDLKVDGALLRRSLDDVLWVGVQSVAPGGTISVAVRPAGRGVTITVASRTVVGAPDDQALYIARRLVERMSGSITIADPDDDTSTTVINLRGT